ncbi:hypothetical protein ACLNGM_20220 [Aureimonas phyllosphaerae]|uniref:winged helix domain-containing protein n=1 Tax=Aureimonas phyllosphaerae TaxID=1166078 RepID=UPI003A5BE576
MSRYQIRARVLPDGIPMTLVGRTAWCLEQLVAAGVKGCTPIDRPAPRWSDYIHKLRGKGLVVETIDERHGGTFSGEHGRYVLRSEVEILRDDDERSAA